MPLHSARISLLSHLSPTAVIARLRELAPQRRHPTAASQAANIVAWRLSEQPDGFTLRPLLMTPRDSWAPRFVGVVQARDSGSCLSGEVRAHWTARAFSSVLIAAAAVMPILELFFPAPASSAHERISTALRMAIIGGGIVAAGLLMMYFGLRLVTAATRELLTAAASDANAR